MITAGEIAQVLTAIAAVGAWISSCVIGKKNIKKIDAVHQLTNSRMSELIALNRKEATALEKQRGEDDARNT